MVLVTKSAVGLTDEDVVKAFLISGVLGAAFVKDSKENANKAPLKTESKEGLVKLSVCIKQLKEIISLGTTRRNFNIFEK